MNKLQPLDLEDIEGKILSKIKREIKLYADGGDEWKDIYEEFEGLNNTFRILEITVNDIKQRLKSAVKGLKKEIENKKIDTAKLQNPEEIISMTKKELANEVNIEIDEILLTIKKWFPDVLEEVKE